MILEFFALLITMGFIGSLFYIIHIQKELLSQSNRNLRPLRDQNAFSSNNDQAIIPASNNQFQPASVEDSLDGKNPIVESKELPREEMIEEDGRSMGSKTKENPTVQKSRFGLLTSLSKYTYNPFASKKTETVIQHENIAKLKSNLKTSLLASSTRCKQLGTIEIFKLKLQRISHNQKSNLQKFEFGKSKIGPYVKNEKVIMILGATGSGKTTLINSMINYLFGVEYADKFRFKLVTEDTDGGGNQANSQTSSITAYTIHHRKGFNVEYTLTIIDTPGFGDTRGIQRDAEITKQIHSFFTITGKEGIDHIDAVGFVAQSSLARLTFTQKYIFDQILSLFGKDIGENIYLLLTFADGQAPQVLNGIKEAKMPYQTHFKFNNSVIFNDNSTEDEFALMFWQMGMKSFANFFSRFSTIKPKSLTQTKSVLEERERIETQIIGLQQEIQLGLSKLEQLSKEVKVVEDHKADLSRNENFTYTVDEDTAVKHDLPPNTFVTNCLICNNSCHNPCGIADDDDKYGCAAMDGGGRDDAKCTVCNQRCGWRNHKNMPYFFTIEREEVTKTSEDLKRRYLDADGKVKSAKRIIEEMVDEFEAVQIKVIGITEILRKSINKLNEIALKPNPLSTCQYIEILIESEKANAEPGWQDRIQHLNEVKKKVEQLAELSEEGYDPFAAYKLKIKQDRGNNEGVWAAVGCYLKKIDFF